jgi:hypothetical protein
MFKIGFCARIWKTLLFSRLLGGRQIGQPEQPSLWECGNPRSVRVSKLRETEDELVRGVQSIPPRSVISTAKPLDFQGIGETLTFLAHLDQNERFSESRVICMFFQILVQSPKYKWILFLTSGRTACWSCGCSRRCSSTSAGLRSRERFPHSVSKPQAIVRFLGRRPHGIEALHVLLRSEHAARRLRPSIVSWSASSCCRASCVAFTAPGVRAWRKTSTTV